MSPEVIGLVAGAFTTFASIPQILQALRTRSMKDVSLLTLCMLAFGVTLWLYYGYAIRSRPVVVWNLVSLCLYLTQVGLKIVTGERGPVDVRRALRSP